MSMPEIYGTLGPACSDQKTLTEMFSAGMTGMRLNMSHTSLAESAALIDTFHAAAKTAGVTPQLLIDLQGPELRIGGLTEPRVLEAGTRIVTGADDLPMPAPVLRAARKGDLILLDDGKIKLEVLECTGDTVSKTEPDASAPVLSCVVLRGGTLLGHKSIKIIGKEIPAPVLTAQDLENLKDAPLYGVTAVMQPFVRSGEDLCVLRQAMKEAGADSLRIFAKIENRAGMEHLSEILPEADMIVIARGDLGNDMPLWELPAAQDQIARSCRTAGKPFLVVTQMLDSMVRNPVPTRAEVSDIYHAVKDGASAVMVTNETAVGAWPADVIRYLANTAKAAVRYRTAAFFDFIPMLTRF